MDLSEVGETPALAKYDFYLGPWLVQPGRNVIAGECGETRLEPMIMQVLLCLAASPGETLSREALNERVWEGRVVSEKVLTRAISSLRKAFGDEAKQPAYIETVSKTGYRLLVAPDFPEPTPKTRVRNRVWPWAVPALAMAVIAMVWLVVTREPATREETRPPLAFGPAMPMTTYPGHELRPQLSPAGDRLLFAWQGEDQDNWDIYLRHVSNGEPHRLTDHPDADLSPAWSPDGSRVAYFRFGEDECGIYVQPVPGGTAQKVRDCFRLGGADIAFWAPRLTWDRDGSALIFSSATKDQPQQLRIVRFSLDSGRLSALSHPPDGMVGDIDPALSKDGRYLAVSRVKNWSARDLWVIDRESGRETRLTSDGRILLGHAWDTEGKNLVFSSNRDGVYRLWHVSGQGGPVRWFPASGGYLKYPNIAGGALTYESWQYDTNLWRIDIAGEKEASRAVASTRWDDQPDYDPVYGRVAFVSNRNGSYEIWSADADGKRPLALTQFGGPVPAAPRWSPDGNALVFALWREGNADLYLWRRGMGPPQPVLTTADQELLADWSVDGDSLFYTSNRGGDWQIWRMPVDGGEPETITSDGGFMSVPTLDGEALVVVREGDKDLWRLPLAGGPPTRLFSLDTIGDWGNMAVVAGGIFFVRRDPDFAGRLAFFEFASGEETILKDLPENLAFHQPGMTAPPDGSWILLSQVDQTEDDIHLMAWGDYLSLLSQE